MLSYPNIVRLEKAATDNGFDIKGSGSDPAWLSFSSSQTPLRIALSVTPDDLYLLALSSIPVFDALSSSADPFPGPLPPGTSRALSVPTSEALHQLLRRAFQLSRALPHDHLHIFLTRTATFPRTTEVERLAIQRVGQDIFRASLLDYWQGACALTGLAVPELLRASHIKPWAACTTDAERLNVFNGLLLAPHLDAAFDRGFITLDDDGHVLVSDALDPHARCVLGLNKPLSARSIDEKHRLFLRWQRLELFRR